MIVARLLLGRRFAEHPLRTLLSLAGVAVGAALAVAVLGFLGSLTGSVEKLVSGLAGPADLEVRAASWDGIPDTLFFEVEAVPGVARAVPVVSAPVFAGGRRALLLGLDQRAEALGTILAAGQRDRLAASGGRPGAFLGDALARELGVGEGGEVALSARGGQRRLPILGLLRGEGAELNGGRLVLTSIPQAQEILGRPGRIDAVLVVAGRGAPTDALARELSRLAGPSAIVEPPARRVEQARTATRAMRIGMQLGVGVGFVVGGFVIYNTMSIAASERRRELATVRALGGRRRRLLRLFLLEAAGLAVAGSSLGSVLGLAISRRLVEAVPPAVVSQVGVEVGFVLPPFAVPVAVVGSVGVAVLATLLPARRAAGVSPVESMRPEGVLEDPDRVDGLAPLPTFGGLALTGVLFLLAVTAPPAIGVGAMWGMFVSIILVTYGLAHPLARAAGAVAGRFGSSGRLAAASVVRSPRRAWAASAAVTAAVAAVVAQAGVFDNLTGWMTESLGSLRRVDLYVSAEDPNSPGAGRELPAAWGADLEAIPGVAHVGAHSATAVSYRNRWVVLAGVEGSVGAEPPMARLSRAERAEVEAGRAAVVSTRFAEVNGVGPGSRLVLPTPAGPRELRVLAAVPSLVPEGQQVTIGRRALIDWFGHAGVEDYLLSIAPGADPGEVRAAVERFAAESGVPVALNSGDEYIGTAYGTLEQVRALFSSMTWVIVGAAALAILNALLISVVERRRELGILRALGTSRRRLRRMVALEAGSVGLVGGAIGCAVGFFMHRTSMAPILAPLTESSGLPVEYSFVGGPAFFALALGVAVAVAGSLGPARRAGAVNVVEAIGYE